MGIRYLALIILLLPASACKKQAGCTKFGSENYDPDAIIEDGSCILNREKFLGTFTVSSDCQDAYDCTIAETDGDANVVIQGLADTLGEISAHVYYDNLTIEQQQVSTSVTIEGAGVYLGGDSVSLSFRMRRLQNGQETIYDCFEVLAKQ